jgi:hypothetical protein
MARERSRRALEVPMPTLLELCLEEADLTTDERFIRCVATSGGEPGLALDREGAVRWMPDGPAEYGLWVSGDDRLVLLRGEGAGPITVSRGGRSLEAPVEKPVVLLDQDLLRVNGRQLRVHLHGITDQVFPPERLSAASFARALRATAAAIALAAVGVGGSAAAEPGHRVGAPPPIEVRARPPIARPAQFPITCDVISIARQGRRGPILVTARCPASPPIPVGSLGQLLDAAGKQIEGGGVTVTKVDGTRLVGETQLKKPVKVPKLRFYVR